MSLFFPSCAELQHLLGRRRQQSKERVANKSANKNDDSIHGPPAVLSPSRERERERDGMLKQEDSISFFCSKVGRKKPHHSFIHCDRDAVFNILLFRMSYPGAVKFA